MPTKGSLSEVSLKHGGWSWRPQLQEWHKLIYLEAGRLEAGVEQRFVPTLLRRDKDRRLIKSLNKVALTDFNQEHGFTYGENTKS